MNGAKQGLKKDNPYGSNAGGPEFFEFTAASLIFSSTVSAFIKN
jgi:hypothetical protein